jgi:hypothetical protein
MKQMLALSIAFLPLLAQAQNIPVESMTDVELSTFARAHTLGLPTLSYDTIQGERVAYSGIAVQLFRAPRLLQLFNPWAPAAYGRSEQNLVFDPLTKRPAGLKFFTINF